ncbi:hypothetical protein Aph02nite_17230 [Actinoplanes philippinensis]|uniref:Uncharacterized protein n=1 Tax=Actinoplanes philippinensis TaxID=35752 RepID=A0A1I2BBT3_9ACTN|nr:hypothetical protein [Actinoplanes philippinensis]GIE75773.1 hypothetical protein Aph02nite_17230 [Actinoplanes philippinensis]SFE52753.1 hypothetical protein SAMN05421541_102187 [Actinoplanes philippinensis]
MRRRLRFAVARLLARIPGGCQQTVWLWANRRTRRPWARVQPGCRELAVRYGWCPCGTVTGPDQVELGAAMRRHPAGRARGGENR